MSCKDRTSEFAAIAESLSSRLPPGSRNRAPVRKQTSQFSDIAAQINRDIQVATSKLQRLTKLAQKKSIFDDPAAEIQELTYNIKQDITNLNNQIGRLQHHIQERRDVLGSKQGEQHSQTVVDSLKSTLNATTKEFKDVVQMRTENLKQQQIRKQQFTFSNGTAGIPPSETLGKQKIVPVGSSAPLMDSQSNRSDFVLDMAHAAQSQMYQNNYQASRATAVESVESTIVELSSIFTQLATMVSEQAELVERIDSNVEEMAYNVEQGQNQLLKYLNTVSSNRWLIIKVFFVLLVFLVFFVVFIA
uniref:t-SNARE coiled-coil homology domain-containing protein n=1 Tax=Cyanoptyche gloeocystis TaxID=77922 RepID=A0A7S2JJE2_9EUKA|mmetsp:Transcript_1041/g.1985  ORF Transcript_1041/g.1985 Transcript_1041/m.1985 type:complete len:303 (+) Transcript_1041:121-1029(+)